MSTLRTDHELVDEADTDEVLADARTIDYLPGLLLLIGVGLPG